MFLLGLSEVDQHTLTRTTAQIATCCTTMSLVYATTLSLYFGSIRSVGQAHAVILVRFVIHLMQPSPKSLWLGNNKADYTAVFQPLGSFVNASAMCSMVSFHSWTFMSRSWWYVQGNDILHRLRALAYLATLLWRQAGRPSYFAGRHLRPPNLSHCCICFGNSRPGDDHKGIDWIQ